MIESERALSRCSAHGLNHDPRVAAGCVLCQRERRSKAAPNASGRTCSAVALVAVLAVIFGGTWFAYSKGIWGNVDAPRVATVFGAVLTPTAPPSATSAARLPAFGGEFTARNASGRSGYFFVPARASTGALPRMVVLHGTGAARPHARLRRDADVLRRALARAEPPRARAPEGPGAEGRRRVPPTASNRPAHRGLRRAQRTEGEAGARRRRAPLQLHERLPRVPALPAPVHALSSATGLRRAARRRCSSAASFTQCSKTCITG